MIELRLINKNTSPDELIKILNKLIKDVEQQNKFKIISIKLLFRKNKIYSNIING